MYWIAIRALDRFLFTSDVTFFSGNTQLDVSNLRESLLTTESDYFLFSTDSKFDHNEVTIPYGYGEIIISSVLLSAISIQEHLITYCSSDALVFGESVFDRALACHDWYHRVEHGLAGKIFSKGLLQDVLSHIPTDCARIPVLLFTMMAYLRADCVSFIDASFDSSTSPTLPSFPLPLFDPQALSLLEQLSVLVNDRSVYIRNTFTRSLAMSYLQFLQSSVDALPEDQAAILVCDTAHQIKRFPTLYELLHFHGLPQLTNDQRMLVNVYECGYFPHSLLIKASSTTLTDGRRLSLETPLINVEKASTADRLSLISIVTVVRNLIDQERLGYFESMLNSVQWQDYPQARIEHLVVDGSSTDGTVGYLTELWEAGRITRLISEPDTSVYNAMNKAMSYLNGDCFLFLNSDDYLASDAITRLTQALEAESADYAFADAWQIDARNNKVGVVKGDIDSAWFKVPYCHQTLLCRTFPLSGHRFDESYKITMMQYALDLRAGPWKWAYVPEKLAFYRIGDGVSSAPANRERYLQEVYRVKDYSADMLGLSREHYESLDQAWRRVNSERVYQQFLALVDEVKADMPATELTEAFCASMKRFGQSRLDEYRRLHPENTAPVNLALFNSHAYGGAGGAVLRLHLALREAPGVQSTLITRDMVEDRVIPNSRIIAEPESGWNALQHRVRTAAEATQFTVDEGCIPADMLDEIIATHDAFSLQWTARMLSVRDIGRIVDSGKPVFITVRDMEPITGGCHYFHGCNHWRYRQCQDCPQIVVGDKRLASETFAEKLKVLTRPNVTFVALSDLTESVLRQSPIAYANPIVKIGNGFDPDTLRILDRQQARRALGLDEAFAERYLIGMMPSFNSTVKGFDVALSALREAEQQSAGFQDRCGLLVAGYPADSDDLGINLPMQAIGALGDAGALNLFYSACDLIIVPSREETFSNTVAEALLCGTPVFGAMAGAIPEMITDEVNGRLFSHDWDSARIAEALVECCEKDFSRETCRAAITEGFSQHQQVTRYIEVFS